MTRAFLETLGLGQEQREVYRSVVVSLCWVRAIVGSRGRTRVEVLCWGVPCALRSCFLSCCGGFTCLTLLGAVLGSTSTRASPTQAGLAMQVHCPHMSYSPDPQDLFTSWVSLFSREILGWQICPSRFPMQTTQRNY